MVLKSLFDRLGKKESVPEPPIVGDDGWVEMVGGRLVVHDPQKDDGRYATISPEGCIRLFVNDEEVKEATAVTASDRIRCDVAADPVHFFETAIAPDRMSVTMVLTADPYRIPDTVSMVGLHQVRLTSDYSPRARSRPFPPRQLILEHLLSKGVVFGVEEQVIEAEVAAPTGKPLVIARGQVPRAPVQGHWAWRLDELSLAEAGQVIAEFTGDQSNQPRITVLGERTAVYEDLPEPPGYLAGNGTRIVQPGRLVASASGRARAVPAPQGQRVHIFPAQLMDGDVQGSLESKADIIVRGSISDAVVTTSGEILVMGGVQKSELRAETITIRGAASESQLYTMAVGHLAPFRGELAWVIDRLKGMRSALHGHQPVTEEGYREVAAFVRGLRRRAELMALKSPEFQSATEDLARVFMGAQTWTAIDLPTLGRLLGGLEKTVKAGEHATAGARDIHARSLEKCTAWVGRDLHVSERVQGSSLHVGGDIRTPEAAVLSQSELSCGGEIQVGILATVRGAAAVVLRGAVRMEVTEAQVGSTFEFGGERKVFERDQVRISASPNAKGQLIFRQKEA